jgi:hypothetical protein
MKKEYEEWINKYVAENNGNVEYRCASASAEMIKHFPELKRERGWVFAKMAHELMPYEHQHWWCSDAEGNVIDPTASQFVYLSNYEIYNEEKHGPLPTGKCHDCGEYVYNNASFCDEVCESRTMIYLNSL